jgi:hypothetical protein
MQEYITWILANYGTIITGLLAIVGGFSVIAKLTPTPKDDAIIAKIVAVLDFVAMNKQRTP